MLLRRLKGHGVAGGGGLLLGLALGGGLVPYAVGVATGAIVVAVAILGFRLGHRLIRRVDRALPDRVTEREFSLWANPATRPMTDDPDYLDGIEAGMRAARRSAGHEDGRILESDRLAGRPTP